MFKLLAPVLALALLSSVADAQGSFSYPDTASALAALKAKPGVQFRQQDGWTIATDEADMSIWSFTPPGSPAYPAAVRRRIIRKDGVGRVELSGVCEASKDACNALMKGFQDSIREANAKGAQGAQGGK